MNEPHVDFMQLGESEKLIDIEQYIKVTQLPVVEERVKQIIPMVQGRLKFATSLACTEDNYKTVKTVRANTRKERDSVSQMRTAIRNEILRPFEAADAALKELIAIYDDADIELAGKVNGVEGEIKSRKAEEIRAYYNEHCAAVGLDFIPFECAEIKVGMSNSMKSLKDQAKTFVDRVIGDIEMIATLDHSDEIMVEFKKSLNASEAVRIVGQRHIAMEAEAARRVEAAQTNEALETAATKVEQFMPPVEAPAPVEQEKLLCVTFSVTGSRDQLKALKKFLDDGGYRYE